MTGERRQPTLFVVGRPAGTFEISQPYDSAYQQQPFTEAQPLHCRDDGAGKCQSLCGQVMTGNQKQEAGGKYLRPEWLPMGCFYKHEQRPESNVCRECARLAAQYRGEWA